MNYLPTEILREEITRAFILSQCLEPLANKPGCTTRAVDSSPGTKLEYFIVSAVNSVGPIFELVNRIMMVGDQPDCIWDVAYEAQLRSPRNRNGGKVNYGQIFLLFPLITAQCLLNLEGKSPYDIDAILAKVGPSMRATTAKDIIYLQKMADLSRELSEQHNRRLDITRVLPQRYPDFSPYDNVFDAMNAVDFAHTTLAAEIREGYPVCRAIADELRDHKTKGILQRSEEVYADLFPRYGRADIVADFIVPGIYLTFVGFPEAILLP